MMSHAKPELAFALAVLLLAVPRTQAFAQQTRCSYRECAVAIVPAWNGLQVVRQSDNRAVANLNFFFPTDISGALAGPDMNVIGADSALFHARHSVALRRIGAAFTDIGGVALGVAAVRALRAGHLDHTNQNTGMAGAGALLLSVPFQFAADGALSRAVWWHNLRYAR